MSSDLAAEMIESLEDYKTRMDTPMEGLAAMLGKCGMVREAVNDDLIVLIATESLDAMFKMLSTVMPETMLKQVVATAADAVVAGYRHGEDR